MLFDDLKQRAKELHTKDGPTYDEIEVYEFARDVLDLIKALEKFHDEIGI